MHGRAAFTFQRVIARCRKDSSTPLVKAPVDAVFFADYGSVGFLPISRCLA